MTARVLGASFNDAAELISQFDDAGFFGFDIPGLAGCGCSDKMSLTEHRCTVREKPIFCILRCTNQMCKLLRGTKWVLHPNSHNL